MRQPRNKAYSAILVLFFLCLLLGETTYYQYKSGNDVCSQKFTEPEMKKVDSVLTLVEQYQTRHTLNSRTILAHIERKMPAGIRAGVVFLVLSALAAFVIETKRWEQEQSLCQFQTFFQILLNVLHMRDGKKHNFSV